MDRMPQAQQHQTIGVLQHTAGVRPEEYWDFQPGQRVRTTDGPTGKVDHVDDGPYPGSEEYHVTLDGGLGGGRYTASQLRADTASTAALEGTAAYDYPELTQVLIDKPDPARVQLTASLRTKAALNLPEGSSFHFTPDYGNGEHTLELHGEGNKLGEMNWATHDGNVGIVKTHPDYRRRGVGTALLTKAHELSDQHGLAHPGGSAFYTDGGAALRDSFDGGQRADVGHLPTEVHGGPGSGAADMRQHIIDDHGFHSSADMVHSMDEEKLHSWHKELARFTPCGFGKEQPSLQQHDKQPEPEQLGLFSSLITTAAVDPDFRFQVTAAWRDVVAKAKRIRAEGGVRVTMVSEGIFFGEVQGDHHVYETGLQRLPGRMAAHSWACGCKWGAYHWGAEDDFSRFAGRMCSHALALQYEAQSRGMFGRDINADEHKPAWVPRHVVVRHDIDSGTNKLQLSSARTAGYDYYGEWDGQEDDGQSRAKTHEWDSIHEGLGDIHRGVNVHLRPEDHDIVHDQRRPAVERAQHLLRSLPHSELGQGREGLGRHWTDSDGVAESFGEMDHSDNRHGWKPTSVVFHARTPERGDIDENPDQHDGMIYGYHDHGESEIPLHPGAGVDLKGISWKNLGEPHDEDFTTVHGDGLFDQHYQHHDFGEHGHSAHASLGHPSATPMGLIARAAVDAGEDPDEVALALRTAGVQADQGELFDSSPYKVEQGGWGEDYGDDENGYRWHKGEDGERVYPCHNHYCDEGGAHENGESAQRHRDVYTNWDTVHQHLGPHLHRGMALDLPHDVNSVVHDDSRSTAERAHALADHLREQGLGMHWTPNHEQAQHYTGVSDSNGNDTHVVVHAHTPGKDAIETDPDTLAERDVIAHGDHDDTEVPLREGAELKLKGISWRHRGDKKWVRHDFDQPVQHEASVDSPFGEPSGSAYLLPKTPGATSPKMPWENPASAGPLSAADPVGWNRKLPLESYAALDSALFEPDGAAPDGAEAMLHEEPEAALPATDGVQLPSDDEALTPSMTAGLRTRALAEFTPAEQQELINEGEGVKAANLDRLDIAGTHYAELEKVLASQDDDATWLA